MAWQESRTGSGLTVIEQGGDGAAVERALRRLDPDLRLVPQEHPAGMIWKVFVDQGPDRPATFVLAWQNELGEPLPLSSRLIDEVQRHAKEGRGNYKTEDELNREKKERERKQSDTDNQDLVEDWLMPHGRPVLHRGQHLRMSRDKQRARGKKV